MPSWSEVLGDRAIRRQKTLGMPGGFEALHAPLALTRRPMRVFTPVLEVATVPMFHPREALALGRAVALQLERIRISFLRILPSARLYRERRGGERV